MPTEIEHKYLVKDDSYIAMSTSHHHIRQGYLSRVPERTVRVRTRDNKGFLTVKGKNHGDSRLEFEYEIPYDDAIRMLELCEHPILDKTRYVVPFGGNDWEVDRFNGPVPLTTAEIELPSSDTHYDLPPFIGENITGRPEYYNSNIYKLLQPGNR